MSLAQRLALLEDRLDRLLIAGWQQGRPDCERLQAEIEPIANLGLNSLAERLKAVAQATTPQESLAAVTLVSAQLRLIRAQLPAGSDGSLPLRPAQAKKTTAATLLPISQVSLAGAPVWTAVRLHGTYGVELLLVEAEGLRPLESVKGTPRWTAHFPLGGGQSVARVCLSEWSPSPLEPERFSRLFPGGKAKPGAPVLGYGALILDQLQPDDLRTYAWIDPTHASLLEGYITEPTWALLWQQDGLAAPLALVELSHGEVHHLLPNLPADPCPVLRAP